MNNEPYSIESMNLEMYSNSQTAQSPVIVTLLGEYFFNQPWFSICAGTWKLANLPYPIYIINDGTLSIESQEKLTAMGFNVPSLLSVNEQVNSILDNLPAISSLRKQSNFI